MLTSLSSSLYIPLGPRRRHICIRVSPEVDGGEGTSASKYRPTLTGAWRWYLTSTTKDLPLDAALRDRISEVVTLLVVSWGCEPESRPSTRIYGNPFLFCEVQQLIMRSTAPETHPMIYLSPRTSLCLQKTSRAGLFDL